MMPSTTSERPSPLLAGSAILYLATAVALLFAPEELLELGGVTGSPVTAVLLQIVGAANLGFGMLDWLSRYAVIGGIFGRPLVVANLAYAATAALTLVHLVMRTAGAPAFWVALAAYAVVATGFGATLVRPVRPRGGAGA